MLGVVTGGAALAAAGVTLVVVGVLGWRRRLPRNRFAGVRTVATLRDDETFAVGNRVGAPASMAGGAVALLGGLGALGAPSVGTGWLLVGLAVAGTLGLTMVGGVLGDRAAARVPVPSLGGCTGVCAGCPLVEGRGGAPTTKPR